MKLGIVTTSFPRHVGDLAGHFVASHVELLRRDGHNVEVIAAGDAGAVRREQRSEGLAPTRISGLVPTVPTVPTGSAPPPTSVRDSGLSPTVPALPRLRITRIPSSLFFGGGAPEAIASRGLLAALAPAARWLTAAATSAPRWDAACAHWLVPSALAAMVTPGPLLAIGHGGDVHLLRRVGLLTPVLTLLLLRRARLAFVSAELAALARATLPTSLHRRFDAATLIQPMGVDCPHFAALAATTAPPHPRPYALVLARLVPIKGVELAISTIAALDAASGTAIDLVIAGDGPDRPRLERLAAPHAARIRFLGALSTSAREPWLAHAAAVLVPSRRLPDGTREGMPQVALEALAAGVPLLASATGGLATLAAPAVLLPEADRDPRSWAAALAALLAAPPPAAALRAAATAYDWPTVSAALWSHWMS